MIGSQRVLITGAGGFVGSWLIDRLSSGLPAGSVIMAAGRREFGATEGVQLDVTRPSEVHDLIAGFRPSFIVHLAGVSSLQEARLQSRKAWDINLFGTINVAEAVMRYVPQARFINAGSSEVYGGSFNCVGGVLDETALLDPRNTYASTKAAADLVLGQMAEAGLASVRFRPFNHTGPGQSPRFVVPSFAHQIAAVERGERPPVLRVGNLDARRDFLDVRDVVEAYRLAILTPDLPSGVIFNIASGMSRRMGDVLDTLLSMSPSSITIEQDEALTRPSDIPLTGGDARRAAALLGWQPSIAWETTLRDVLEAQRRCLTRT